MKPPPPWLALLSDIRLGHGIDALASAWARGDEGAAKWYAESLRGYLGGSASAHSQEKFRSVLAFFFAWASEHRAQQEGTATRLLSPDEVLESDVRAWGAWLEQGGSWVVPAFAGSPTEQALVQLVEDHGSGSGLDYKALYALARQRGVSVPEGAPEFTAMLGQLVRRHFIARTPRTADVRIRDDQGRLRRLRSGQTPPPDAFRYLAVVARGGAAPATVSTRLACLSGFFRAVLRPKNLRGVPCPVGSNPASFALEKASRATASESRPRSEARKTTRADLELLLSLIDHAPGRSEVVRARDHLLVALLFSMGLRLGEVLGARQGDLGEAPSGEGVRLALRVHRKGGKAQLLAVSERVQARLQAYRQALSESDREPAWLEVALSPGAPLVHAARRWGHAAEAVDGRVQRARAGRARSPRAAREIHPALVPMSSPGAERVFARYVEVAVEQVAEGPAREAARAKLLARIHPHGLRHLFAQMALEGGMSLREVAHQLGHQGQGTLERTYAPRVDDMLFDYGRLLEGALGEKLPLVPPQPPAPTATPAPPPRRKAPPESSAPEPVVPTKGEGAQAPRQGERQPAFRELRPEAAKGEALPEQALAPPTILAIGAQGRAPSFEASPLWAYQERPLLLDKGQVSHLDAQGLRAPRSAVSASGLPEVLQDRARLFSGLSSLLPYRVLEPQGGMRANPASKLFVPVPCLVRATGSIGDLVRLGEALVDPASGPKRASLLRWWVYLLAAGRSVVAQKDTGGAVTWLAFAEEEPAWNGPGESQSAWRARIHATHLRAHAVGEGIGAFLGQHGGAWPTGFVPDLLSPFSVASVASGEMAANAPQSLSGQVLEVLDMSRAQAVSVGHAMAQASGPVARDLVRAFVG